MSTSGISLRLITKNDLEFVRGLRNQNRRSFFYTKSITKSQQQGWFNALNYDFYIIWLGDERIGTISEHAIVNIPLTTKRYCGLFEVGNLMLSKEYQGRGYMTEAMRHLTKRGGFFVAFVKTSNKASIKVFERGEFWEVKDGLV